MEGDSSASSALGAHMIEQLSNHTEARSVGEQRDVEHNGQSDSVYSHDADSSARES